MFSHLKRVRFLRRKVTFFFVLWLLKTFVLNDFCLKKITLLKIFRYFLKLKRYDRKYLILPSFYDKKLLLKYNIK